MKEYTLRCVTCKQDLPYSEFPLKRDNTRDATCRECKKTRQKKYYENNKQYYKDQAVRQREAGVAYIRRIKTATPCADCKRKYHYCVMDFDHREGETKLFIISRAPWVRGRKQIEEEIAKCDVVCANCHRIRTYMRAGHFDNPKFPSAPKGNKLQPYHIDRIFKLYATGEYTHKQIAERYGVHRSAISHILAGRTHKKWRKKVSGKVDDVLGGQTEHADKESRSCN